MTYFVADLKSTGTGLNFLDDLKVAGKNVIAPLNYSSLLLETGGTDKLLLETGSRLTQEVDLFTRTMLHELTPSTTPSTPPAVGTLYVDYYTKLLKISTGTSYRLVTEIAKGGLIIDYASNGITYRSHTFQVSTNETKQFVFELFQDTECDILVVAGGGGGGGADNNLHGGGGGGAGGYILNSGTLTRGFYNLTVGDGGAGAGVGNSGTNGESSTFFYDAIVGPSSANLIANGGGGGGSSNDPGLDGASGGGAGGGSANSGGQVNIAGQGYPGGNAVDNTPTYSYGAGGGGGATSAGLQNAGANYDGQGGNGGSALSNTYLDGTTKFYSGGGGGGGGEGGNPGSVLGGNGGNNVGGNGGSNAASIEGQDGVFATGGGGGGGRPGGTYTGGKGGSGVIIVRYKI